MEKNHPMTTGILVRCSTTKVREACGELHGPYTRTSRIRPDC